MTRGAPAHEGPDRSPADRSPRMRAMFTYDLMETVRNTNQWLGASARAWGATPLMAATGHPMVEWVKAWGEVTERSFARMVAKPDWGIPTVPAEDGRDHTVR